MKIDPLKKLFLKLDSLDISTLQNFARRLWTDQQSLQHVFNIVREGIIVIDSLGTIDFFNTAACDIIALNAQNSIGDCLWKYIPTATPLFQNLNKTPNSCSSVCLQEISVFYPRHMLLRINIVPFICENQSEQKFVVIISDITDDKTSTATQLQNERFSSITLLASGVAHELGNPLNSIALRLHLMQKQTKQIKLSTETRKIQQSIDICLSEISRLDGIIKNFLQAVRPTKLSLSEINLNNTIHEVCSILEPELLNAHISIKIKSDKNYTILGDSNQLKQAFFNIIKNGAESMSHEGSITITLSETESNIDLSIKDMGTGISCEMIDKIFQPYFSTKASGNGLGMLIVERIIREHGAHFSINSTIGEGTEVLIKFQKKDIKFPMLAN